MAPGDHNAASTYPLVKALEKNLCQSRKRFINTGRKRLTMTGTEPMFRNEVSKCDVIVVIAKKDDLVLNRPRIQVLMARSDRKSVV